MNLAHQLVQMLQQQAQPKPMLQGPQNGPMQPQPQMPQGQPMPQQGQPMPQPMQQPQGIAALLQGLRNPAQAQQGMQAGNPRGWLNQNVWNPTSRPDMNPSQPQMGGPLARFGFGRSGGRFGR